MKKAFALVFGALAYFAPFSAWSQSGNTSCALPELMKMDDGHSIKTIPQWISRRKELLNLFEKEMYGTAPEKPADLKFLVSESDTNALHGTATRKQVSVLFDGKTDGPKMDILIYLPNRRTHPASVILGLNFNGNQSIAGDPSIKITTAWMNPKAKAVINNQATEAGRGTDSGQWPLETIINRGYALATVYCGEIDPDFDDGFTNGIQGLYPTLQNRNDNFATIAAWAWGLSRAMDYLETEKGVNAKQVAVFGFSRLGKAALWAGATDERFAMVISNESGAGGAKLFHHPSGENIKRLCTVFPHWFCKNFKKYIDKDNCLPFDQHMVISLIAPRPVYIASAAEDLNSDPVGEFLAAKAAYPVYRLLGTSGLPADSMPALNSPVSGQIGYHIRSGKHDVTSYDWKCFLDFADARFRKPL